MRQDHGDQPRPSFLAEVGYRDWATLLRPAVVVEVLLGVTCGDQRRILPLVSEEPVAREILEHRHGRRAGCFPFRILVIACAALVACGAAETEVLRDGAPAAPRLGPRPLIPNQIPIRPISFEVTG